MAIEKSDDIVEYDNGESTFRFNKTTNILHIKGIEPERARPIILQMIKEQWLPKKIKTIWFSGDPVQFISGINTTIYMTAKPPKKKKEKRTFTDIVKST